VLGTRQTGEMQFHIADLLRDEGLLAAVEQGGRELLQHYPERVTPLIRRWLGEAVDYGEV
jgi:ATP-dependent DNA helicase RecG